MLQPSIRAVETLSGKRLRLEYSTGEIKIFDVTPHIRGDWFGELGDENYFRSVRVLPDGSGIEWINGQDIAPHELYYSSTKCKE
jgi:hypothetical protein